MSVTLRRSLVGLAIVGGAALAGIGWASAQTTPTTPTPNSPSTTVPRDDSRPGCHHDHSNSGNTSTSQDDTINL